MNPQEEIKLLNEILDAIIETLHEIIDSGESLNNELQTLLEDEIEWAINRITELQKIEQEGLELEQVEAEQAQVASELGPPVAAPKVTGEPVPPLSPAPHPSSNINAFRYEPESQKLFVKFQDKYPQQNGPVYAYEGVPKYIAEVFARGAVAPKTSGKNKWHRWKKGVTPSHGAAMFALIKSGAFPYSRLR